VEKFVAVLLNLCTKQAISARFSEIDGHDGLTEPIRVIGKSES